MSGLINKVKEAIHSDKKSEAPEGTHGSHNSKIANAADPRIDSDRDHRANPAGGVGSATTGHNDPEGVHGPHGSRVANAADPRVDSDRDHRAAGHNTTGLGHTAGGVTGSNTGYDNSTGLGHTTGHSTGVGHTTGGMGSHEPNVTGYNDPTGTHGQHNSRIANAADPRIDSDRDHRAVPGSHTHGTIGNTIGSSTHGTTGNEFSTTQGSNVTGYNDPTGTHGHHNSKVANAADPRIDSDRDHRAAPGGAGTMHTGSGPGPAPNTAGPHSKDMLNKVDPRVDSDLDGSKTFGGNKTLS